MVHWLSSSIFPCSFVVRCLLSRYGNTRPNLHLLWYIQAWEPFTNPVPLDTKQYQVILTQYHQVPTSKSDLNYVPGLMISFFYSSYLFPFFTPYTISYYLFLSHITLSFVHQANIRSLIYMLHRSCGHHHSQLSWRPDTSSDGTSCLRARVLIFTRKSNNIQKKLRLSARVIVVSQ